MRLLLIVMTFLAAAYGQKSEYRVGIWRGRPVTYRMVNGQPITQGDIVLENVEQVESSVSSKDSHREATGVSPSQFRWTDRTIPYVIDAAVPNPKRVTDAIQHWNDNSIMKLVARTDERNYVRFIRNNANGGACTSRLGMIGGEQGIQTDDTCTVNVIIHEIGHAVGLNHEQSRIDRDRFLVINWDNLDPREFSQFDQRINRSSDLGLYDFGSIMHYSARSGFENKPLVPGMQTIPRGIPIGLASGLSAGDLDAVSRMYGLTPASTVITTYPAGLDIIVDGARVTSPKGFTWAPGSTHTVSVPDGPQGSATVRYLFGRWNDDGEQNHTITASADVTVYEAAFVRQFLIPKSSNPAAGGSVAIDPPSDDGFYTDGTPVVITAQPADGFSFYSWSRILVGSGTHGFADNPARTLITGNFDYTAVFRAFPMNVVLDSVPPNRLVAIDNNAFNAVYATAFTAGSNHTINTSTTQLGPSGASRFVFTGWSDSGTTAHSIAVTDKPATFTANFRTDHLLTANVDQLVSGAGTIERVPPSSDGFYEAGTQVQLIARPSPGFQFVNWVGDATGTNPAATMIMDGQKVVNGIFRASGSTPFSGILNAATLQQVGYVAPGELLVINGTQGAPDGLATAQATGGLLPTLLANTRVAIDGKFSPVASVNGNQVNTMVPFSAAGKPTVQVFIVYNDRNNTASVIEVVAAVPGIFTVDGTGSGPAKVTNEDGTANADGAPAGRGTVIRFQGTGFGKMSPVIGDAALVGDNAPVPELPVTVKIGDADAEVISATGVKGSLGGLVEVSVRVPDGAPSGAAPIVLRVGGIAARQHVTVSVQ